MQSFSARILPVMLWELWRASRWEMLARYSIIAAFLTLIFSISQDFGEVHREVIRGVVILLVGVGCVFSTTWLGDLDNHKAGFTFRLGYTRPISNLQMVLVPTVYSVANAMLGYFACALLVQLMLGQRLPLLGPSLIFGCLVSVSTAVVWSSTHTAEKLIALFAVVGLSLGLLAARHSLHSGDTQILLAIGKPEFFDLAWYEYLGLFLISSLSLAATIFAVGQQRFGEGVRWSSLMVRAVNAIATQRWWISGIFGFLLMVAMASLHTTLAQQWPLWGKVIEEILTGLARVLSGEFKPVAESVVPEPAIDWRSIHSLWWLAGLCTFVGLYCSTTAMCLTFVMAICKYQKIFTALVFLATASLGV
jgi:hypothetical protein